MQSIDQSINESWSAYLGLRLLLREGELRLARRGRVGRGAIGTRSAISTPILRGLLLRPPDRVIGRGRGLGAIRPPLCTVVVGRTRHLATLGAGGRLLCVCRAGEG